MWRGIQLLTTVHCEKKTKKEFFLEIHKKSGELQRCVRTATEKNEENNTSYSLQCLQNVAGVSLNDERIIDAQIRHSITFFLTFCVNSNVVS